ncbi:MAG TPA: TIGR03013 family XrtA/PEP-CTERM system glycosyltransferase [Planctomycetota bacterium]|nr:TIGR03013 family XrtA/PEP-CTERM system glycosyltransferase [Planctomycetota bacterium]
MIRVLRHYLPLRRALLVFSETLLLFVALGLGMTAHLWSDSTQSVMTELANVRMTGDTALWRCLLSSALIAVVAQVGIAFNELYDFRISMSRFDRASRFVSSAGSAVLLSLALVSLARVWNLSRVLDFPGLKYTQLVQALVFTLLCGFGLLYLWRNAFHFALRRWNFNERVLLLGAGPSATSLAAEMLRHSDSGYEAVAMIPEAEGHGVERPAAKDRPHAGNGNGNGKRELGGGDALGESQFHRHGNAHAGTALLLEPVTLQKTSVEALMQLDTSTAQPLSEPLFELVRRLQIDVVVVALQDRRGNLPTDQLLRCRLAGIAVKEREALYEHITGKIAVEAMRPSYLIFNDGFSRSPQSEILKRVIDVAFSLTGILLTWPVMVATAIVVRAESRGPALFKQARVGFDEQEFTLYKFRSMRADAEAATGAVWAKDNDPRITGCGRFIRKTRLDELPQLFNILNGDMSLVGPRPERKVFVDSLEQKIPYYSQRHIVKPGLTGWAQINYPYGNTVEDALQKLQYDLFYIKNQSFLFDLSILFNTIKTVILRKGT